MKIQIGEVYMDKVTSQKIIYPNKTKKYLLPCLKEYGSEFEKKINSVFKVAVGLGDIVISNRGMAHERHIFILIDSTVAIKFFIDFLDWIKDQVMYEDDYVFGDIQKSNFHMVILKFPEKFWGLFTPFKKGEYSTMFSSDTVKQLFNNHPKVAKVLIRDRNYRIVFTKKLNKIYGLTLNPHEYDGELDGPPRDEEEYFNHHLK